MESKTNLPAQISEYHFAGAIIATVMKQQDWANLWRVLFLRIKFHAAKSNKGQICCTSLYQGLYGSLSSSAYKQLLINHA